MFHRFVGFPPHFGEYSNVEKLDKMAVALVGLMCGTPQNN
jgi:hypothetical protein